MSRLFKSSPEGLPEGPPEGLAESLREELQQSRLRLEVLAVLVVAGLAALAWGGCRAEGGAGRASARAAGPTGRASARPSRRPGSRPIAARPVAFRSAAGSVPARGRAKGESSAARSGDAPAAPARASASSARPGAASTRAEPFAIDSRRDVRARFPVVPGRTWQYASYLGAAGKRIPALFRAARRPGRRPAIILGHGHGGDARSMARFFGAVISRRVHVLAVNHPFHGHGRKVPGQDICPRDARLLVRRWIQAVRDLRHSVLALRSRADVDPQRIGYLGFSLGACLGALFVSHEPAIRAAVLVSPAGDWDVLARTDSYWHIGWHHQPLGAWLRDPALRPLLARIDPARAIARFAPRPLLLVVGRSDRVIRDASGLALYRAAGRGKVLWHHPGGHGPGRRLRRRAARWLEERLLPRR